MKRVCVLDRRGRHSHNVKVGNLGQIRTACFQRFFCCRLCHELNPRGHDFVDRSKNNDNMIMYTNTGHHRHAQTVLWCKYITESCRHPADIDTSTARDRPGRLASGPRGRAGHTTLTWRHRHWLPGRKRHTHTLLTQTSTGTDTHGTH